MAFRAGAPSAPLRREKRRARGAATRPSARGRIDLSVVIDHTEARARTYRRRLQELLENPLEDMFLHYEEPGQTNDAGAIQYVL